MIKKLSTILITLICMFTLSFTYSQKTVSLGAAPFQTFQSWSLQPDYAGSRAFIYDGAAYPSMQLKKHPLGNPAASVNVGGTVSFGFPAGATVDPNTGFYYVVDQLSPYAMYRVDSITGVRTFLFNCTGITLTNLTGITWSIPNSTMYGIQSNLTSSQIFTINMTNGVCTTIGAPSAICAGAISISASRSGTLFVIDIVADNFYKVNRTTGVFTLVGPLGVNANYGQDAQFDLSDDKLYWAAYTTGPQLRLVDTASGSSTVIGSYPSQITTLGIYGKANEIKKYLNDNSMVVFPNPANSIVHISAKQIESIKIFNVAGQLLRNLEVDKDNVQLDVSHYQSGIYYLQVKTSEGLVTRKITVSN